MLVNTYNTPEAVELKVVNGKKDEVEDVLRHNPLSVVNPKEPTGKEEVALQKMFNITFSYLQKAYKTKVLKTVYRGTPIYKVVLNSNVSNVALCWLKRQKDEWVLLLGDNINPALFGSITYAIDRQE